MKLKKLLQYIKLLITFIYVLAFLYVNNNNTIIGNISLKLCNIFFIITMLIVVYNFISDNRDTTFNFHTVKKILKQCPLFFLGLIIATIFVSFSIRCCFGIMLYDDIIYVYYIIFCSLLPINFIMSIIKHILSREHKTVKDLMHHSLSDTVKNINCGFIFNLLIFFVLGFFLRYIIFIYYLKDVNININTIETSFYLNIFTTHSGYENSSNLSNHLNNSNEESINNFPDTNQTVDRNTNLPNTGVLSSYIARHRNNTSPVYRYHQNPQRPWGFRSRPLPQLQPNVDPFYNNQRPQLINSIARPNIPQQNWALQVVDDPYLRIQNNRQLVNNTYGIQNNRPLVNNTSQPIIQNNAQLINNISQPIIQNNPPLVNNNQGIQNNYQLVNNNQGIQNNYQLVNNNQGIQNNYPLINNNQGIQSNSQLVNNTPVHLALREIINDVPGNNNTFANYIANPRTELNCVESEIFVGIELRNDYEFALFIKDCMYNTWGTLVTRFDGALEFNTDNGPLLIYSNENNQSLRTRMGGENVAINTTWGFFHYDRPVYGKPLMFPRRFNNPELIYDRNGNHQPYLFCLANVLKEQGQMGFSTVSFGRLGNEDQDYLRKILRDYNFPRHNGDYSNNRLLRDRLRNL